MRILAGLAMGVNACASARTGPGSQDRPWPAYLGSAAHVSPRVDTMAADPQPVWRADIARGIIGAPALAEDVVAVSQADAQVALLDRATGDVLWRHRVGAVPAAGPLLNDDRLFVSTQTPNGGVEALRLSDGKRLWKLDLGDSGAPLAWEPGVVYATTTRGWVTAIETDEGRIRWKVRLPGAIRCAPIPVSSGIVVVTAADSMFLLDRATGAPRVRRPTAGVVLAEPALAHGRVLIGTSGGILAALDTADLTTAWSREIGSPILGSIAVLGDTAYALTQSGVLWIVPVDSAAAARRVDIGLVARAGPAPVPGGVYVVSVDGELTRLDPAGTRGWSVRLKAPVVEPVTADGRMLFAVSERGEVVAFR